MSAQTTRTARSLARVIPAAATLEGGGFLVHRPIPARAIDQVDPFLLLDEMGPMDHAPGEAMGAPDHPHKGFELITYLLAGEMEHLDSHGNHGILRAGDAQYMLGGTGLVHSEMPSDEFKRSGGHRHGFQIWVNLSRADKALAPRYKDVSAASIPVVATVAGRDGARAGGRSIRRGRSGAHRDAVDLRARHARARRARGAAGAAWLDRDRVRVRRHGPYRRARSTPRRLRGVRRTTARRSRSRTPAPTPLEALLLNARPVGEPMVRYGPFVMNSADEIERAFEDFQAGRFGAIKPLAAE